MKNLKPVLIFSMLELMRAGANLRPVTISTSQLSKRLGQSQQAASQHLLELEKGGFIERRRVGSKLTVRITREGTEVLESLHMELRGALRRGPNRYSFRGRLFQGLGEGGYYISLHGYKKQFSKLLGYEPFPGTMNLKLESPDDVEQKRQMRLREGLRVEGFENGKRTYGGATCYPALVNGRYQAAILVIDRTHYDDTVLELISSLHLRKELGLKNGDEVSVDVSL